MDLENKSIIELLAKVIEEGKPQAVFAGKKGFFSVLSSAY